MPPSAKFTRQKVLDGAYELVAERGIETLTARNVAARLSCSTAPIYGSFASVDELANAVIARAREKLRSYCRREFTERPFLNQGTGLVLFAQENPQLFRLLFLTRERSGATVPQVHAEVLEDMRRDPRFAAFAPDQRLVVLEKLWFVAIGMATLAYSDQLDAKTAPAIAASLLEAGAALIPAAIARLSAPAGPLRAGAPGPPPPPG
jgi:AcrR family transcriptional regulator